MDPFVKGKTSRTHVIRGGKGVPCPTIVCDSDSCDLFGGTTYVHSNTIFTNPCEPLVDYLKSVGFGQPDFKEVSFNTEDYTAPGDPSRKRPAEGVECEIAKLYRTNPLIVDFDLVKANSKPASNEKSLYQCRVCGVFLDKSELVAASATNKCLCKGCTADKGADYSSVSNGMTQFGPWSDSVEIKVKIPTFTSDPADESVLALAGQIVDGCELSFDDNEDEYASEGYRSATVTCVFGKSTASSAHSGADAYRRAMANMMALARHRLAQMDGGETTLFANVGAVARFPERYLALLTGPFKCENQVANVTTYRVDFTCRITAGKHVFNVAVTNCKNDAFVNRAVACKAVFAYVVRLISKVQFDFWCSYIYGREIGASNCIRGITIDQNWYRLVIETCSAVADTVY
jgi:hypothetical protein